MNKNEYQQFLTLLKGLLNSSRMRKFLMTYRAYLLSFTRLMCAKNKKPICPTNDVRHLECDSLEIIRISYINMACQCFLPVQICKEKMLYFIPLWGPIGN